jgi:hypothetical protein
MANLSHDEFWALINVGVTLVSLIGIFVAYRLATRKYRNCEGCKQGRHF